MVDSGRWWRRGGALVLGRDRAPVWEDGKVLGMDMLAATQQCEGP